MATITIAPSRETLTTRAAIAFLELLEDHFDDIALDRYGPGPPECPCQRRAESARHIAQLCRKLTEELRTCERYERICQDIEYDEQDRP